MTLDRNPKHLQPHMAEKVRLLLNDCLAERICVFLNETWRDPARQRALYAQGRRGPNDKRPIVTQAKWYQSLHPWGLAIDLYPCDKDGDPIWSFDPHAAPWPRVVQLAKMRGLAWGGDWRTFKDYPHFQDDAAPATWRLLLRYPRGWKP